MSSLPENPEAVRNQAVAENIESEPWMMAVRAAESKKAVDVRVLDLREVTSFTDRFVVCTGTNSRQIQAISDEVELRLKQQGTYPLGIEGYERAEWVLVDYGDFIVHIFSQQAREFYDLERLWRGAKAVQIPEAPPQA